jgi:hypothetical protein
MESIRDEIKNELKRTRLDKVRLYELLLNIVDNVKITEGPRGRIGHTGPEGPQGPQGPPGECKCKCTKEETSAPVEVKPKTTSTKKKTSTTTKKTTTPA